MSLRAGIRAISRPGRSKGSWTELLRRQGSRRAEKTGFANLVPKFGTLFAGFGLYLQIRFIDSFN